MDFKRVKETLIHKMAKLMLPEAFNKMILDARMIDLLATPISNIDEFVEWSTKATDLVWEFDPGIKERDGVPLYIIVRNNYDRAVLSKPK